MIEPHEMRNQRPPPAATLVLDLTLVKPTRAHATGPLPLDANLPYLRIRKDKQNNAILDAK